MGTSARKIAKNKVGESRLVKADARKVVKKKAGRVVVLVHGFRGSPEGLEEMAECLSSKGYEVLIPEIPPTGRAMSEYTPGAYAEFLAEYIREKGLKRPVLVGHSMGSIVVAAMAAEHPELIADELVLLAPIIKHPPKFIVWISPLANFLPNGLASRLSTRYLFAGRGRELYRKCLKLTIKCGAKSGETKAQGAAAKFSCRYGVADFELKQKVLFVVGKKDRMVREAEVEAEAKKVGGEVRVLDGCGHLLNYECPVKVAGAIDEFLRG